MDNIEFLKTIVSNETLKQYEQLKDCENCLNDTNIHQQDFKIEGSELILYIALRDILLSIKDDKKYLNKQKLIVCYNTFIYNIRKLLKIIDKDEQLENSLKEFALEKKDELLYLKILNKILINFYTNSTINELSTIYLYYGALITLEQIIDKNLQKLFTINDSNSKNIYVQFNDNIDIEQVSTNINKIKNLILTYKNNQEKS